MIASAAKCPAVRVWLGGSEGWSLPVPLDPVQDLQVNASTVMLGLMLCEPCPSVAKASCHTPGLCSCPAVPSALVRRRCKPSARPGLGMAH